jgi:hypothetical protein
LLAGELVPLIDPAMVSRETIRRRLAENELKLWQRTGWSIAMVDAEFVVRREGQRGQVDRFDYEYRRNGTANVFVFVNAHEPWRHSRPTRLPPELSSLATRPT